MLASEEARERVTAKPEAPIPPDLQPPPRDLAEEQRAALPPRLRAKLDHELGEEPESFAPRSRGRGVWITALVVLTLVAAAIVLMRIGVIPGLPFMAPPGHAPASAPVAAVPVPTDTSSHAAPADSAAKEVPATLTHPAVSPGEPQVGAVKSSSTASSVSSAALAPTSATTTGTAAPKAAAGALDASGPATSAATKPAVAQTFGISVATYLDSDRAEAEKVKLAASTGMTVAVREAHEGGTSVYHLVVGGFDSRVSAEDAASDLVKKGLVEEARIVPGPKVAKR